jgi:hypothetical protein
MQTAAYQCCSFLCYSWLTTAIIIFCREKYLLIDTTKGRREWLVNRLEEMKNATAKRTKYSYYVETHTGQKRKCCGSAWEFAYGISPTTKKKHPVAEI